MLRIAGVLLALVLSLDGGGLFMPRPAAAAASSSIPSILAQRSRSRETPRELRESPSERRRREAAESEQASSFSIVWLLFFASAGICFYAMRREQLAQRQAYVARVPRFWLVLGIFLAMLGLAKLLGVRTMIDTLGRSFLRAEDEYEGRRLVQAVLIIQTAIFGLLALAACIYFIRKTFRQYLVPMIGAIYLAVFGVIRAISLHQVDALMRTDLCGIELGSYIDLLGIGIVTYAAVMAIRRDLRPKLRAFETKVRIR